MKMEENQRTREQLILRREQGAYRGLYGCCPYCGFSEGPFNLYKENWFVCTEHLIRWCASYNVFDHLDGEWDAAEVMERFLSKYREIPPSEADLPPDTTLKLGLGRTVITPAAQEALNADDVQTSLGRHASGDWGDTHPQDALANDVAMVRGDRLLSVFHDRARTAFWVVTEANRSVTTVLLPEDY
ncbi:hypothetical protein RAS1_07670 [Phycisphaerae bacterium RAS1]|nr:hypothetical protein RAS1_07670 [Phycisphaerae bacterium RAS1]